MGSWSWGLFSQSTDRVCLGSEDLPPTPPQPSTLHPDSHRQLRVQQHLGPAGVGALGTQLRAVDATFFMAMHRSGWYWLLGQRDLGSNPDCHS